MTSDNKQPTLYRYHLIALSVLFIINIREYPLLASMGWSAILYSTLAFVGFLLPSAWVCAQLASRYPEQGGIYTWITQAFGSSIGFVAITIEVLNNLISFPATMTMILAAVLTIVMPHWTPHAAPMTMLTLGLCWLCVYIACKSRYLTTRISLWTALVGIMLPSLLIILLAISWVITGHPIALRSAHTQAATSPMTHIGFFISILYAFSGMQASAFFAPNVNQPTRTFPVALLISAVIIFLIMTTAGLSIAIVIPSQSIDYVNGLIDSFRVFFLAFHLSFLTPCVITVIAFGSMITIATWMLALARGLHQAALQHQFPRYLKTIHANGTPLRAIITEGCIVSVIIVLMSVIPDLQTAYWLLILLTSQICVILYIALFLAAIKLLYRHQSLLKNSITIACSTLGTISSTVALCASFKKPQHIIWNQHTYLDIVTGCDITIFIILLIMFGLRHLLQSRATVR